MVTCKRFWIGHVPYASKTQALLVLQRIRPVDVSSDVILEGDSVWFSDVEKILGCTWMVV
jgi:hypothetical protein